MGHPDTAQGGQARLGPGEVGRGPRRQARNDLARRKALARVALVAAGAFVAACLAWPFAATVKRVVPPTPPADRP